MGASLFDHRYGLGERIPARLRTMPDFPNDALRRDVCDGDLMLQLRADQARHDDPRDYGGLTYPQRASTR
ncbi:hypothetical protein Raf01_97710 [Rugosimonospora africana]|uniref:Dyp-type peroxidase N-terminal domain-containing protein n=1 Tax=Rugosimonospora africana TaxID=556532 RepID=A0A8J3R4F7_9ACTN|nr:hypothetical protein Raf01_97710 [Rugosimonospora africana]